MKNMLLLAVITIAAVTAIGCKSQASLKAFKEVETRMLNEHKDDASLFSKRCGYGIITAIVYDYVSVEDADGRIFTATVGKGTYPKKQPLDHFAGKSRCYLVVETRVEARRLNREHAQLLVDRTHGASIIEVPEKPTVGSEVYNHLQATGIRWKDGDGIDQDYLVDYYVAREEPIVQAVQKDFDLFLKRRWDSYP